ncbi:conserved hypothetical protein [Culex quinquefasciatus]|uniref:Uncharacterized protein n=1 Tax=Culex quinquefasciatus TaxID=7176 RepID=B0X891_CULQU|nr:conserved hypothetical protein [Culex quinquefasciatus]|eukprot:XP_001865863.1 conserved hypothetical protein [Culex quinquefasciatus]
MSDSNGFKNGGSSDSQNGSHENGNQHRKPDEEEDTVYHPDTRLPFLACWGVYFQEGPRQEVSRPLLPGKNSLEKSLGLFKVNDYEQELLKKAISKLIKNIQKGEEYNDGSVRLRNPNIELMDQDILYHLALGSGSHDLVEMFGDVKVS